MPVNSVKLLFWAQPSKLPPCAFQTTNVLVIPMLFYHYHCGFIPILQVHYPRTLFSQSAFQCNMKSRKYFLIPSGLYWWRIPTCTKRTKEQKNCVSTTYRMTILELLSLWGPHSQYQEQPCNIVIYHTWILLFECLCFMVWISVWMFTVFQAEYLPRVTPGYNAVHLF